MKKQLLKGTYFFLSAIFLFYLLLPAPPFPSPPPNSLVSTEPGDVRDPLIRGFYTDMDREAIAQFYLHQFGPIPTLRLKDYPPEEADERVMDEIKSSYLEEFVHPMRESIFVSVWQPTDPRFEINIDGKKWLNKITVRYYPSAVLARVLVGSLTIVATWYLIKFVSKLKDYAR